MDDADVVEREIDEDSGEEEWFFLSNDTAR